MMEFSEDNKAVNRWK